MKAVKCAIAGAVNALRPRPTGVLPTGVLPTGAPPNGPLPAMRAAATPGRLLSVLLFALLAVALVALAVSGGQLVAGLHNNRMIGDLTIGRDLEVEDYHAAETQFARSYFLLVRDRLEEAQRLVGRVAEGGDKGLLAAVHYDLANAYLRTAFRLLEGQQVDPAIPLIRLAKASYRQALMLDPDFWDAKHNLDVAMRLIRDFPQVEHHAKDEPTTRPKQLWTELPGLPKGLP